MAKVGDTVRYLNDVGGGVITRIEGRMAYVEEDGFENPVLVSDLVVTMPAGHDNVKTGARLMFDQKAFDTGRREEKLSKVVETPQPEAQQLPPAPETAYGDRLNITLAFEPRDAKKLSETSFNAVLVNDSNYCLTFTFARRSDGDREWTPVFSDTVQPNELIDLVQFTHADLTDFEHIAFQCIAYKQEKSYELKLPVGVKRKLDLTKFHKLHCFRPGVYFDTPVLELPLVKNDTPVKGGAELEEQKVQFVKMYTASAPTDRDTSSDRTKKKKQKPADPASNPHKLLPPIEVDLHIAELTDSVAGLEPKDMLEMQLEEVRRTMKAHSRRIGQKIVFIHGKGEGVLRKEMMKLLKKEYPECDIQDASFREYGFGASLITIKAPRR